MITKDLAEVREVDLQSLVVNAVLEQKTIDYERMLPTTDEERIDFLAEVSSFANAAGGEIIYGIAQDSKTGFPCKLEGLSLKNLDQ